MNIKNFNRLEVLTVTRALDLNINDDSREWVSIKSPIRDGDQNPSFCIYLDTGYWEDKGGNNEKGYLPELVRRLRHIHDDKSLREWFDAVLHRTPKPKINVTSAGNKSKDILIDDLPSIPLSEIKDARKFDLSDFDDVMTIPDLPLLGEIRNHDGITIETLSNFGCKISQEKHGFELLIPYPTGVQRYWRVDNEKKILSLAGSKTQESFAGVSMISGRDKLLITKSPRETMLAHQIYKEEYDVLGLCGSERSELSMDQLAIIKAALPNVRQIITALDSDTDSAKNIAVGFADNLKAFVGDECQVSRLDVSSISTGKAKDLADIFRDNPELADGLLEKAIPIDSKINAVSKSDPKFWNSNGAIEKAVLLEKLEEKGLFKRYIADEARYYFVEDNVIKTVNESQLRDIIKEMIKSIPDSILEKSLRKKVMSSLITTNTGQLLETANIKKDIGLHQDDKTTCYLYFSDKCIKVTSNSIDELPYKEIDGPIWEQDIVERKAPVYSNSTKSEFEAFSELVTEGNLLRKQSLMSAIGYLQHRYKNKANAKAIIFTDQEIGITNASNGGTGKTMGVKAIGYLRPLHEMDGKGFNSKNKFKFNDYQEHFRVMLIDDVGKGFAFEDMFSIITGNMPIRKLHKNRFSIPFKDAPKFALTTNDPLTGSGESHKRRQFIIELGSFFHSKNTIEDHFGHLFFDDWDEAEWSNFDTFMIKCVQLFLNKGLIEAPINYEKRKLIIETSLSFFEWAFQHLELDVEYDQVSLFKGRSEIGLNTYPGMLKPKNKNGDSFPSYLMRAPGDLDENQTTTFKRRLEKFADFKGWKMNQRESSGSTFIWFTKIDKEK